MNTNTPSGEIFGHPKGLFLLFGTEMWERFSYYGMRAILVLYLTELTTKGGLGWTQADALKLYGIFTGLVYVTPLLGGWLADNVIGQRKAIIYGGILMALGQFALGTPHKFIPGMEEMAFYVGLVLLVVGNGLFKPNISTMVGDLYKEGDHRRDGAFTIFYMGINLGAAFAPLVIGTIAESFQWQYGFIAAGVGMLISVAMQQILAPQYLGNIGNVPAAQLEAAKRKEGESKAPLTKEERDRLKVIMILGIFTIMFWVGFEQAGGLLNIFARDNTDRMIGDFEVKATWFQSVNAIFIVMFAPIIAGIWVKMGAREPSSPIKFMFALIFLALGFVCMLGAMWDINNSEDGKANMMWLVGLYFFHTIGELCLSPIGLSMVTKLAPLRIVSFMMGVWFVFIAAANYTAGWVGSLVGEDTSMTTIFAAVGGASLLCAGILYLISDKLLDWMHGAEGPGPVSTSDKTDEEISVTAAHEGTKTSH
jgi:POT family proton-dependent oligopeptide transporter